MAHRLRSNVRAAAFTVFVVLLLAAALTPVVDYFLPLMLATVMVSVAFFVVVFPGSRFFTLSLANSMAVYACLFVLFVETNFGLVADWAIYAGFPLPIVAFLAGAWWRREGIRAIVTAEGLREERGFARVLAWLVPVFGIGALTFLLPGSGLERAGHDVAFLVAMGAIAAVVFAVSRDVCTFMLDLGILFEEFFKRASGLLVPAFAFLTFYSLLVIVFASLYRILDVYSSEDHFVIGGATRDITFLESLYFSIVTLATVGYGDIVPRTDLVRAIVAVEIVLGVLLLLFGFNEIFSYAREHRRRGPS